MSTICNIEITLNSPFLSDGLGLIQLVPTTGERGISIGMDGVAGLAEGGISEEIDSLLLLEFGGFTLGTPKYKTIQKTG